MEYVHLVSRNPTHQKHNSAKRPKVKMLNTKDYNSLTLAQPTNFKAMLHSGELLWGTGCRIAHPEAARVVAATPYNFCFLDAVSAKLFEISLSTEYDKPEYWPGTRAL